MVVPVWVVVVVCGCCGHVCGCHVHSGVGARHPRDLVVDGGVVVGGGDVVVVVVVPRRPGVWAFVVLKVTVDVACA